jgi:ATP adenylyltransferase
VIPRVRVNESYPYNLGHSLICTYRHVADLTELLEAEQTEIIQNSSSAYAMKVSESPKCQGV